MHNELRRMFCRFDFPTFPKKWVISSPAVIDERRFMFDYYLKNVFKVRVIQQSDIVKKFLKPDTENGNAPAPGIPVTMTNSYGNGSPSMTNSINENENKVQDNRVNNPAALPTQNPSVSQPASSPPKTQTQRSVTPKTTAPDSRTLEAFNKNEFPIYIHTSPLSCITYQP